MAGDTRDRMISATSQLIRRHGYKGSSLNEVLTASDAPRGSLYHHFPGGKEQLVLEATRQGIERVTGALEQVMESSGDPRAGVRAYIEAIAAELLRTDYGFGCPVAPVVLDDPRRGSELAELCRDTFARWEEIYTRHLRLAGVAPVRAASLATTIIAAVEGAILMARAACDTAALAAVADDMEVLITVAMAA